MQVGDLVQIIDPLTAGDERSTGTVLRLDYYRSDYGRQCGVNHLPEPIIECLWNTGKTSWILQSRVKLIGNCYLQMPNDLRGNEL